jgi:hypothetical protein
MVASAVPTMANPPTAAAAAVSRALVLLIFLIEVFLSRGVGAGVPLLTSALSQ